MHGSEQQVLRLRAQARKTARSASLRYIEDNALGLRRVGKPHKFTYQDARGRLLRNAAQLARIRSLAIPPAYTDVWICADPDGHLQATGRDARGRKQYRYHPRWSAARDQDKHHRICDFAKRLPGLRAHCRRMLRKRGLPREKVLSALLCIIDQTAIRVGHEEYTRDNDSFGLTTLRVRHARVSGAVVELKFRGKSGILHSVRFHAAGLAKIIQACRSLRGPQLFQYRDDDGKVHPIRAEHLNAYLRTLTAPHYSVKDFRTWSATVNVAVELRAKGPAATQRAAKVALREAICKAANYLGNTPSVCRKSYVHPTILDAYLAGQTLPPTAASGRREPCAHEKSVLAFLTLLQRKATRRRTPGPRATVTALERAS